jgi:hypothetical protein
VARITPEYLWDRQGITWTKISSKGATFRLLESGTIAETGGPAIFSRNGDDSLLYFLAFLNSTIADRMLALINPTLNIQTADVLKLPLAVSEADWVIDYAKQAIGLAKADWDAFETSSEFVAHPFRLCEDCMTIATAFERWVGACECRLRTMDRIEREKNELLLNAYGLTGDLPTALPEKEITLCRPDREEDIKRLISYAIGCMMGRYSLDQTGLTYAHSGNKGFDPSQYKTFPADQDGIVPLTDTAWFDDDATNRIIEFIGVAWPHEHLEENLKFIADSLGLNRGGQPRDTIRQYLAQDFFKDHLKTYKRRPIYWLFSSGKQRAFQCLVYLHRYNEGTLSRMRTEYVIPLQGKVSARIEQLAGDIAAATSTAFRSKLTKERDKLLKQQAELQSFDEKLRHYADLRISLDLDDGVKVNYGKFGDLLAEVKAVTGGKNED